MESDCEFIPFSVQPNNLLVGVKSLAKVVRPKWSLDSCKFKVFTEGISNQLVGCFPDGGEPAILFRVYGKGTELFLDRNAEKRNMVLLSNAGLGPALIASFENGIIYYFVPGTLVTADTVSDPVIWPLIARKMAAMHRLTLSDPCVLWKKIRTFIDLLPDDLSNQDKFKRFNLQIPTKKDILEELNWMQASLQSTTSPLLFCHNDLLLANIIIKEGRNGVEFIDYEYGGTNYQAFDIANHFCEYAGVDNMDFNRVPSQAYQRTWIREYLEAFQGSQPTDAVVERTARQVLQFIPVSHFHWGVWALVQAVLSEIDFDFADYARKKLDQYFKSKSNIADYS